MAQRRATHSRRLQTRSNSQSASVSAGILVLTACALLLDYIVTKAEARLLVWRPKQAETEVL